MTTAPRILCLSGAAASTFSASDAAALDFTALLLTDLADASVIGDLAARAEDSGLRLLTVLPPGDAAARSHLRAGLDAGVRGFLATAVHRTPAETWRSLIGTARRRDDNCLFIADLLGAPAIAAMELRGVGFDFLLNSVRWWDGAAPWFLDQQAMTRGIAGSIGFAEVPGAALLDSDGDPYRRRTLLAAALASGLLVNADVLGRPALRDLVVETNRLKRNLPVLAENGPRRQLSTAGEMVTVIVRETPGWDDAALVLINTDAAPQEVDIDYWFGLIEGEGRDFREVTPGAEASALG